MKNIIALSIVMAPCFAFAQFSKGQVYVGGTLSTSLQSSTGNGTPPSSNLSKDNSLSISPTIGFFLSPRIALGGSVTYSSSYQEYDGLSFNQSTGTLINAFQKNKTNSIGINSFTRYYIPISNSFYFSLQGQINFTRGNSESKYGTDTQETIQETPYYSLGLNFKRVFIFFPSPKWGIEASVGSLGYSYTRYLPDVSSTNSFSLNAGSFSFGLAYYFAKK